MIRPLSPLPFKAVTLIPLSSANFFANGEIFNRSPFAVGLCFVDAVTTCLLSIVDCLLSSFFSSTFELSDFELWTDLFFSASIIAVTSSPPFPKIASMDSTGALFPCSTPMYKSTPLWKDSNSIVALSVSISASNSPDFTESPTFLCHFATTPSVIVSLNCGIRTIWTVSGIFTSTTSFFTSVFSFLTSEFPLSTSDFLFTSDFKLPTSDFAVTSSLADEFCFASPARSAEISSPSFPKIASIDSTGAPFPSSTPMCSKTPFWNDSNSIVALSVSISASNSPDFTLSPTFLCHFATTPSVMVSLNLGIRTTSAINFLNFWFVDLEKSWITTL